MHLHTDNPLRRIGSIDAAPAALQTIIYATVSDPCIISMGSWRIMEEINEESFLASHCGRSRAILSQGNKRTYLGDATAPDGSPNLA